MTDREQEEADALIDAMVRVAQGYRGKALDGLAAEAVPALAELVASIKPALSAEQAATLVAIGAVLLRVADTERVADGMDRFLHPEGSA